MAPKQRRMLPTRNSARIADKKPVPVMPATVKLDVVRPAVAKPTGKQLPRRPVKRIDKLRAKNLAIKNGDMAKLHALNDSPAKSTRTQSTQRSRISLGTLEKECASLQAKKKAKKKASGKSNSKSSSSSKGSTKSTKSNTSKESVKSNASKGSKGTATSSSSQRLAMINPSSYANDTEWQENDEPNLAVGKSKNKKTSHISDDSDAASYNQPARTTFHGNFYDRATSNAMNQTPTAQENNRLQEERNSLLYKLSEMQKKYSHLKEDYEHLDSDYVHQRDRYKDKNEELKDQLERMTTALAMTGKKDKGRMSTEMVTTVKRLVLEKLWWGTKFIETQEDLIEETKRIADLIGFNDPAEKATWISLYSPAVLNAFNRERQYANNCCFEAAKSKLCVFTQIICKMYTNFSLIIQFAYPTTRIYGYP